MNIRSLLSIGLCVIAELAASGRAGAAQVLYNGSGFVTGQQSFVQSFNITGPGTLTVSLTNVNWPEQLASLNLLVSSSSGLMGPETGAGTDIFHLKGGGTVFAQWFGNAQGPLDTGVYSMNIQFTPSYVNVVPLPASVALMISGLALLAWQRRQRGVHSEHPATT